ncbi:MAG TPA: hypothetical protein VK213_00670 [Bacteroidales bacterium]|nr:hypothetical protein [Bacteroidales bacterium]
MKKAFILLSFLCLIVSCKEKEFSPEGPTDVRIRNITDTDFRNVNIKTSENDDDVATIPLVAAHSTSDYIRFKKAYPKLSISADLLVGNSLQRYTNANTDFTNGIIDFTYMQYLSTQRVTFEVYAPESLKLKISKLIPDEELVLK